MNETSEPRQEIEALRERISALSAAVLRISASLDVTTVLQEAADSACALTAARYGIITTIDEAGEVREFVTSGFTPDEQRQFVDWPDGPKLFAHFRDLPGPIRLTDLPALVRSLGFSPDLMRSKTFQGTPMRYRGVHVGNFFLAEKEGALAFTDEDEEILVLFASQAATAIANARAHRDELRARADLEALIETSPVGVVVFDAKSGRPVSVNREARRIAEGLRTAGRTAEELVDVMSFRRGDGREVSLGEFPIAEQLGTCETVRGEEVELSVPDGRSVRTLINATPIPAEGGGIGSVVVTLQDLAPLEELERLRAEFLGLVSHELRAPLTSIMGSAATLLEESADLDPAEMHEFHRIIREQAGHMRGLIGALLDAGRIEAGTLSVTPEPSEVTALVDRARNTFLSGDGRHTVRIDLPQDLPPGDGRPPAHRAGSEQPARPTRRATRPSPPPSRSRPSAMASTSQFQSRTKAGASRPGSCRICSASMPDPPAAANARPQEPASGSSSARGWWRRTGAAFAPRAQAWARAAASPSPCRRSKTPVKAKPPVPAADPPIRRPIRASPTASWWWTTTRRHFATCATSSAERATPPS